MIYIAITTEHIKQLLCPCIHVHDMLEMFNTERFMREWTRFKYIHAKKRNTLKNYKHERME